MPEPTVPATKHCHFYEPPDEIYAIEEGARWIVGGLASLRSTARTILEVDEPRGPSFGIEEIPDLFYSLHAVHERVMPRNARGVHWDNRDNVFASWETQYDFEWLFDRARSELRGIPSFNGRSYSSMTRMAFELGMTVSSTVLHALKGDFEHERHPLWTCINQSVYDMPETEMGAALEFIGENLEVVAEAVLSKMPITEPFDSVMIKVELRREACIAWQIYDRHLPELQRISDPNNNASSSTLDQTSYYSARELAAEYRLDQTVLEARLRRFRIGNDEGWHEIADAKPREPKFRYRLRAVAKLLDQMKVARNPNA